jgi:hypothetical protein
VGIFMMLLRTNERTTKSLDLKQETNNVAVMVKQKIMFAQAIPDCVEDPIQSLTFTDTDGQPTIFTCDSDSNNITMTIGDVTTDLINPNLSEPNVSNCNFLCYKDNSGKPANVDFTFTLASGTKQEMVFESISLRN